MNQTAELLKSQNNGIIIPNHGPACPYCNGKSILRPETFIYNEHYSDKNYWVCENYPNCNAYVGTHGHGIWQNFPMGRLANPDLRNLKKNAHQLFDHMWKTKTIARGEMYSWMRRVMNLTEPEAHIGELDNDRCRELIEHLNELYSRIKIKM
jgi:hypothetical protein